MLDVQPGITDAASLQYFSESELLHSADDAETVYVTQIMPEKLRINLQYIERANVLTDTGIVCRTILRIARVRSFRKNAASESLPTSGKAA